MSPAVDVLNTFLSNTSNPQLLHRIIAPNATYISLTFANPSLTKVMPWAGTHQDAGPSAVIKTFSDVAQFWEILDFTPTDVFGDDTRAASFGTFTYKSVKLQQTVTSPFAVFLRLNDVGLIEHLQFMEDTLGTTMSFKKEGTWIIESDPHGRRVEI